MSYRVGTTHYNLPQTESSDKRDWADTNQAFADLDAAVYEAGSDAGLALSAAQTAQTSADGAVVDAAAAVTTANAASASATSASEAAALARTEAQSAVTTANSADATAQAAQTTASNADTVALTAQTNIGTMANLQTTDKSSLVAAINEVLSQTGGDSMPILDFANPLYSFSSSNTSFTATKDCYVLGSACTFGNNSSNVSTGTLSINGTAVYAVHAQGFGANNADFTGCGINIPLTKIKAGDVITWSQDTQVYASIKVYDVAS